MLIPCLRVDMLILQNMKMKVFQSELHHCNQNLTWTVVSVRDFVTMKFVHAETWVVQDSCNIAKLHCITLWVWIDYFASKQEICRTLPFCTNSVITKERFNFIALQVWTMCIVTEVLSKLVCCFQKTEVIFFDQPKYSQSFKMSASYM